MGNQQPLCPLFPFPRSRCQACTICITYITCTIRSPFCITLRAYLALANVCQMSQKPVKGKEASVYGGMGVAVPNRYRHVNLRSSSVAFGIHGSLDERARPGRLPSIAISVRTLANAIDTLTDHAIPCSMILFATWNHSIRYYTITPVLKHVR